MKKFFNLGSFNLLGINNFTRYSLSNLEKKNNFHLGALIFKFNITGIASNKIERRDFLRNLVKKFNLYVNNRLYIDNLDGQKLHWFYVRNGSQYVLDLIPSVNEGSFNVDYYMIISFKNVNLVDFYDLCPSVNDVNSIDFEILMGQIPNCNIDSLNLRVYCEVFYRENEYIVPYFKLKSISITKPISDIINIPNRCLFFAMFLPQGGNLNDNIILRSKNNTFIENQNLEDVLFVFNPPSVYDSIQNSDYNFISFFICPDRPISFKKPLLYENDQLFYDNLSNQNVPFDFLTFEIEPNEALIGEALIDSRFSPRKK